MNSIVEYQFFQKLKSLPWVEELWLFGSRAREDNQERADIDLAIVCPKASDKDWMEIAQIIENADTLLNIDYVRFDALESSSDFRKNILRDKKVLYMKTIPWTDYFYTLGQAIDRLQEVLEHPDINKSDYMRDATIQRFEFTVELFWKFLKKALYYEKIESNSPRDVLSKAYQYQLIDSEKTWLQMLDDRNNTSHVYKEEDAQKIFENIKTYLPIFTATYGRLKNRYQL